MDHIPGAPRTSRRLEFIDLLRGWAVIVMIETHVVNATLSSGLMHGTFFEYLKFVNGLVAPSFLFASGLAYAVTTRRKLNDYLAFGKPLSRQVNRLLFILLVGYCLHLPKFSLSMLLNETTAEEWLVFFQVDVLQCIAMSLLFIQALLLALRSERLMYGVLGVITVVVIIVTPLLWGEDFLAVMPAFFAAYLNGLHHSLFPLFPWSAFLFAGALTGYLYLKAKDEDTGEGGRIQRAMFLVAGLGIALMLTSTIVEPFAASAYSTYDYWRFSPSFVLLRMGIVMILCAGMYFYERYRTVRPRSVVTLIGRESFLVYTVHLLLIYGDFGPFNFKDTVNQTFGYPSAFIASVLLLAVMTLLAWWWGTVKKGPVRTKQIIQYGLLALVVGVFLFGPGE